MATCLIVDDSNVVRKLERRIMEGLGFTVSEAENGQEAVDFCKTQTPDLILLDWHMPVMDGITFVKWLRATQDGNTSKVIFCTTATEVSSIMKAMQSGADEYVMKPFDADIIKSKLQQINML